LIKFDFNSIYFEYLQVEFLNKMNNLNNFELIYSLIKFENFEN